MKKAYVWMAAAALAAWIPASVVQAEGNHHQASDQKAMQAGHTHASHHKSDCDKDKKASESKDGKHAYHERTDNSED